MFTRRIARFTLIKASVLVAGFTVVLASGAAQALPQNDGRFGSVVLDYGTAAATPACVLSSSKLPICSSL